MSNVKHVTKTLLQSVFSNQSSAILIASMGRSGSTIVWEAVRTARAKRILLPENFGKRVISGNAWDLTSASLRPGVVYKTHALGHELPKTANAKVVFLYGSASDGALSILSCKERYGIEWVNKHLTHLRAYGNLSDVIESDVLRLEEQIDSWIGRQGTPRILINYEYLWECRSELSKFLKLDIQLPEKRERKSKYYLEEKLITKIKKNYSSLDDKIAKLPKFQIMN